MMLFKLSLRNIRKSVQNYLIYFATLVLGVAIFYVFNALGSQTVMLKVSGDTRDIIRLMMDSLSVVSVFVSFVLGFLIVYASSFLMKRRKREFGIYMLLGMSKRRVSAILIMETLMVGIVSLAIGLLVGVAASQGMSVVVAAMFEADMTNFTFVVSKEAIVKTMICFLIVYVIVIILNAFVVGRSRLISLINSEKRMQKNHAKNPLLCALVFFFACFLLGTAYYNVTAGAANLTEFSDLALQIAKGIIGTFLIFWSVSGFLVTLAKGNKKFYYKGLNCFSTKELSGRINTTVFSGSIICLLLFFTICILSSAMSVKTALNRVLSEKTPMDVQFVMNTTATDPSGTIEQIMEDAGIDLGVLKDRISVRSYEGEALTWGMLLSQADVKSMTGNADGMFLETMRISDYNRQAAAFHMQEFSLEEDEYLIVADFGETKKDIESCLARDAGLLIGGRAYRPKYHECKKGFLAMSNTEDNLGVLIVPDDADLSGFTGVTEYFSANYVTDDAKEREKLDDFFSAKSGGELSLLLNPDDKTHGYIAVTTKTRLYTSSVGLAAIIVFIGVYLGIVFLISGAAILSLKELSEAADSREKYRILRKIGVDERKIGRSLLLQCGVFFGFPLILAVIHSVFGIQTAQLMLAGFGMKGLELSILLSAGIILAIYGIYFWLTYASCRKIIGE